MVIGLWTYESASSSGNEPSLRGPTLTSPGARPAAPGDAGQAPMDQTKVWASATAAAASTRPWP
jgi:hypothetical protein